MSKKKQTKKEASIEEVVITEASLEKTEQVLDAVVAPKSEEIIQTEPTVEKVEKVAVIEPYTTKNKGELKSITGRKETVNGTIYTGIKK